MNKKYLIEDENIEIILTPLIDTVFVLLIIFIIITPQTENIFKVSLPQSTHSKINSDKKYFCIMVDQYENIYSSYKTKITTSELLLRKDEIIQSGVKNAVIFADKDLFLDQVTKIIDTLYAIGFENVYIKTKKLSHA